MVGTSLEPVSVGLMPQNYRPSGEMLSILRMSPRNSVSALVVHDSWLSPRPELGHVFNGNVRLERRAEVVLRTFYTQSMSEARAIFL